jgi:F-type H+-transporting ATPase subunit delta
MTTSPDSRESYGAAADRLAAFIDRGDAGTDERGGIGGRLADAVAAVTRRGPDADKITAMGDELLAVAELLRRQPRLRRALSDSARLREDRVRLLRGLFGGKVGDETLDLLGVLVSGRWSTPGELLDAAERLGVEALLAGAERAGQLADVEDELFRFGQVVSGDYRLAAALGDSSAALERRQKLIDELLDDKVQPATLRLAKLALAGLGGRGFSPSLSRLVELAAQHRDRTVAYVTSAVPLTDADEERLASRLSEMYGQDISLKIDVDPQIIGGVRVKVGSDLYDGTVMRRLAEARAALTK